MPERPGLVLAANSGAARDHHQSRAPNVQSVEAAVIDILGQVDSLQALGLPHSRLCAAYRANLDIDASKLGGPEHLTFVGDDENLRKSLELMA